MPQYPGSPAGPDASAGVTLGRFRFAVVYRHAGGDEGRTIHVFGPTRAEAEAEVLRFDCFKGQPHYHLGFSNRDVPFIPIDAADPFAWALAELGNHSADLLNRAGALPMNAGEAASMTDVVEQLRQTFPATPPQ
jgi:hypothetical protein